MHYLIQKLLLPLLTLLLLASCNSYVQPRPINFYYWKRNVNFGETEKQYFEQLNCRKLYIRFFDIDIDKYEDAEPKAKISLFNPAELNAEYVPVVFITNRTFKGMDNNRLKRLVQSTNELIERIARKNNITDINEIQIDCDWTASTKDQYFNFLKTLKKQSGKNITSTLRLHQVKDIQIMGVPPADKVYLMCYATASPKSTDTENSILDIGLLKAYTKKLDDYPLPVDIALPLYSWGVVTNHRKDIKLINNIDINGMVPGYFKQTGSNTYEAIDDFFLQGIYINKGFTLRIESISPSLLKEARVYIDSKIKKDYAIVYYHLDKPFLERFTIDELK